MNTLVLSRSDFGEALKDCVVGEPKTLTVTVIPDAVSDTTVVATVTEAEYTAPEEGDVEEEAPAETGAYRPSARPGAATAV